MYLKTRTRATAVAALGLAAALVPAASASAQDPVPVGPNQYFSATVNGASSNAVVKVVCPGPIGPNSTGHPISGQTVEVYELLPPTASNVGFTGSAAHQIDAGFVSPSAANAPIVMSAYFVQYQIPTTYNLPCSGQGVVAFVPQPTSGTARNAYVTVTFLNIGV